MAPSGKKTTSKAKQAAAQKEKGKKYEELVTKIYAFCHKHNFHRIVSDMMFETYLKGNDRPYLFMAEYLVNLNNKESLSKYRVLLKDQDNQENLAQLNRQIQIKNAEIEALKLQIGAFERRLKIAPKPIIDKNSCKASTSSSHSLHVSSAKRSGRDTSRILQKSSALSDAESSESDAHPASAKKSEKNKVRKPEKTLVGDSSDALTSLNLSEDSDSDFKPKQIPSSPKDKERTQKKTSSITDDLDVTPNVDNPDSGDKTVIGNSDPEATSDAVSALVMEPRADNAKNSEKPPDDKFKEFSSILELSEESSDACGAKNAKKVTQAPSLVPEVKEKAPKKPSSKVAGAQCSSKKSVVESSQSDSESKIVQAPGKRLRTDKVKSKMVSRVAASTEGPTSELSEDSDDNFFKPSYRVQVTRAAGPDTEIREKNPEQQLRAIDELLCTLYADLEDSTAAKTSDSEPEALPAPAKKQRTDQTEAQAPVKKPIAEKTEARDAMSAKLAADLQLSENSSDAVVADDGSQISQLIQVLPKIEKETTEKALVTTSGSEDENNPKVGTPSCSGAPVPSVIDFQQLISTKTEMKLIEPVVQETLETSPPMHISQDSDGSDIETDDLVIDEHQSSSTRDPGEQEDFMHALELQHKHRQSPDPVENATEPVPVTKTVLQYTITELPVKGEADQPAPVTVSYSYEEDALELDYEPDLDSWE